MVADTPTWETVDTYITDHLLPPDPALEGALAANAAANLPAIDVAPAHGRLLQILARMANARTILEIGTLGGYSTICLARALPEDGTLTTLEALPHHATVARANLTRAGLSDRVDIRVGPALENLPTLTGPYDFVFIDADKESNPAYLDAALRLTRPGSVIVCDNVVRDGRVADPARTDPSLTGIRRLYGRLGTEPRLLSTAVQTVGAKGWDGFSISYVLG